MSKTIWALIEIEDGKAAHLGRAEAIVLGSAAAEVDEHAPIFSVANLGVIGDALTILPQLTQEVKHRKAQ